MISDLVLLKELPQGVRNSIESYIACLSGAILREDYIGYMKEAGFDKIKNRGPKTHLPPPSTNPKLETLSSRPVGIRDSKSPLAFSKSTTPTSLSPRLTAS